jgi:hypothetical protein
MFCQAAKRKVPELVEALEPIRDVRRSVRRGERCDAPAAERESDSLVAIVGFVARFPGDRPVRVVVSHQLSAPTLSFRNPLLRRFEHM